MKTTSVKMTSRQRIAACLSVVLATLVGSAMARADQPTAGSVKVNPKDGAEMVWVPAGEFTMGRNNGRDNEKPQHKVSLDGYWIYKNDVTVAQYRRFCTATGRKMPLMPNWGWKDNHPVVDVRWSDAKAYCDWAGVKLPTEAQWEKAARGADGRKFPWGNEFDEGKLWSSVSKDGDEKAATAPVGSFPTGASPYGCLDMAGNVEQWCADFYDKTYYKNSPHHNPLGPPSSGNLYPNQHTLRGGPWHDDIADHFHTSYRGGDAPSDIQLDAVGFRGAMGP